MSTNRGYYALVQYCPDLSRLEAANIGVLLVCPDAEYADVQLTAGHDRVRRFFRSENIDYEGLAAAKAAITNRVRMDPAAFLDIERLQQFVQSRGNDVILTALRPVRVDSPHATMVSLFEELVGGRHHREPVSNFGVLDEAFRRPSLFGKIRYKQSVTVPIVGKRITAPYAFQNGSLNLIKPERFSSVDGTATAVAMRLAIEGDLLNKYAIDDGSHAKLIVITDFHRTSNDARHKVQTLLDAYKIRSFGVEHVNDLIAEVEQTAH